MDTNDRPLHSTQHLTALAAPEDLIDWRIALCTEAAVGTGLLSRLPATPENLAEELRLDAGAVRAVLQTLAAREYLTVGDDSVYSAGPELPDGRELAAVAQHGTWIRRWSANLIPRLHDRTATGAGAPGSPGDPSAGPRMVGLRGLEAAVQPFIDPVVGTCMAALEPDLREGWRPRVLDLGGGHGAYAREFVRRGCHVTLQDLPAVVEHARERGELEAAGVTLHAGNALEALAPGQFDLVLCGTLTNIFGADDVRRLFSLTLPALTQRGHLAVATWMRNHGPVGAAFGVQMLTATEHGDAHSESDYRRHFADTGYAEPRLHLVGHPPMGLMLARRRLVP